MLKERTLVPFPTSASSESTYEQIATDLQTELHHARAQLSEERFRRAQAEAHVAALQNEREKKPIVPSGDTESGYECPNHWCNTPLVEDYNFCPGCGAEIDWRTWVQPDASTVSPYGRTVETLTAWGRYSGQVHR